MSKLMDIIAILVVIAFSLWLGYALADLIVSFEPPLQQGILLID